MRRPSVPAVLLAVLIAGTGCTAAPKVTPTASAGPVAGVVYTAADHSVALRDLLIPSPGAAGYPAGTPVPLAMQVWNNTNRTVSLIGAAVAGAGPVRLMRVVGGAPSPVVAGATRSAGAGADFTIPLAPGGSAELTARSGLFLQLSCLPNLLAAGTPVTVTFRFDNGTNITAEVPVQPVDPAQPKVAPNAVGGSGPAGSTASCG